MNLETKCVNYYAAESQKITEEKQGIFGGTKGYINTGCYRCGGILYIDDCEYYLPLFKLKDKYIQIKVKEYDDLMLYKNKGESNENNR